MNLVNIHKLKSQIQLFFNLQVLKKWINIHLASPIALYLLSENKDYSLKRRHKPQNKEKICHMESLQQWFWAQFCGNIIYEVHGQYLLLISREPMFFNA